MDCDYSNMFDNFFEKGTLQSDYKCVFLHALIDVGLHGNNDLSGRDWISNERDRIQLDLNFIAIRFIMSYWDVLDLPIRHVRGSITNQQPSNEINILGIIREEESKHTKRPNLEMLASPNMADFRKKVIQKSIKPEVLDHLQTNFKNLYKIVPRTDLIEFNADLVPFLRSQRNYIRKQIESMLADHLKRVNGNSIDLEGFLIEESNPFFRYVVGGERQLFLLGVKTDEQAQHYEKTIKKKITLKSLSKIKQAVCVWGLRSTQDNKKIWNKIKRGDLVLFSEGRVCFGKGIVLDAIHNGDAGRHLWREHVDENVVYDLLIILENVVPTQIDLHGHIKLVNPTVYNEYNFPITQINKSLVDVLLSVYGGVENALDNMSEPLTNKDLDDTTVTLVRGKTTIRKGQQAFRNRILKNYNSRCAVCNISEENLLEASHILPVKYSSFAGDVSNGICLCVLHHKMFDQGYIYFNSHRQLVFANNTPRYLQETCTIREISNSNCRKLPAREYLEKSFEIASMVNA